MNTRSERNATRNKHPLASTRVVATLALLCAVPTAQAQQWLVNNAINYQVVETAICDSALR